MNFFLSESHNMVKVIRCGELISIFIVKNSSGNLALRTIINMSVTNQGNTRIKVGDWCTLTTLRIQQQPQLSPQSHAPALRGEP